MDIHNSDVMEAVRADMEQRTYYWNGERWVTKADYDASPAVGVFTFRGSVTSIDKLPTEGNTIGDQYVVEPPTLTMALTCFADQIKGEPTLNGVMLDATGVANIRPITKGFADTLRDLIMRKLLDEQLALVPSPVIGRDGYVLMARVKVELSAVGVVKAIEVNKLYVKAVPSIDGFEVEVTYGNLPVRIDSSALQ